MSITFRPAQLTDAPAISAICASTADAGQAPNPAAARPELPGLLYALPYLHGPNCYSVVAEDQHGICGYAVATADSLTYYAWLNSSWLPAQRAALPARLNIAIDQRFAASLKRDHQAPDWHANFPAHLHLNLLPRAQGKGVGKQLMATLLQQLQQVGASGVHWGADSANLGALAFYRKLGYQAYAEEPGCVWFALAL